MAWSAPSAGDVLTEFNSGEDAAIRAAQAVDESNLATVLERVVAEVRDAIRSGGYPLDDDETKIPLGLHNDAIAIARWRYMLSVPKLLSLQTKERKESFDRAISKLDRIAKQEWAVEPPADALVAKSGTWNSENKIVMRGHPIPRPAQQSQALPGRYANDDAVEDAP